MVELFIFIELCHIIFYLFSTNCSEIQSLALYKTVTHIQHRFKCQCVFDRCFFIDEKFIINKNVSHEKWLDEPLPCILSLIYPLNHNLFRTTVVNKFIQIFGFSYSCYYQIVSQGSSVVYLDYTATFYNAA